MRIPKSFKLFGSTITTEIVKDFPDIPVPEGGMIQGEYSFCKQHIRLLKQSKNISKQAQEQTYLHELTHAILVYMNHPQHDDETFVEIFSGLLHQSMASSVYK